MRRASLISVVTAAFVLVSGLACSSSSTAGDEPGGEGGSSSGGATGSGGSSGGVGGGTKLPGLDEPAPEAAWTVFVYGHGDHNLSNSLLVDLREMAQAQLTQDVNVLVLTDWDASQVIAESDPPTSFPAGIQLFRVPGNGAELELVAEGEEQNLDDPNLLASVVGEVFQAFPARHRAVVLWDHGGGWRGGFGSDTENGTVTRPQAMPADVVPMAVQAGLEQAGVTAAPALDLFAFDTCLMSGPEVAYPFRQLTHVYIANAEIDYGAGWDYTATLSHIAANPDAEVTALAAEEVAQWDAHHANATANDALLRSHVALDLTKIESFAQASAALTAAVAQSSSFDPIDLGRSTVFALPPYSSQFENGSSEPQLRDMGQLLTALGASSSDPAVASAASAAASALDQLVIASSQGAIRTQSGQKGFHVELGLAAQLTSETRTLYAERAAEWATASGWDSMFQALVSGADQSEPSIEHAILDTALPTLQFSTVDQDAALASVYLARTLDEQTLAFLGLIGSGVIESNSVYDFEWDGTSVVFGDGQPAMLDTWLDVGSSGAEPVFMVPGVLSGASEEPLLTNLVFGASDTAASVAVVTFGSVASTLTLAEIASAAPGATFTPVYLGLDLVTGESSLLTGDAMPMPESGAYPLAFDYVPGGDYQLLTSVTDVWGNQGVVLDPVSLAGPLGP